MGGACGAACHLVHCCPAQVENLSVEVQGDGGLMSRPRNKGEIRQDGSGKTW